MKRAIIILLLMSSVGGGLTSDVLGQWMLTKGPFHGQVTCFANSGNYLLAGSDGGGVFLSKDTGSNWTPINVGLSTYHVFSLLIHNNTMFAGTDVGVFRSTNNGTSWNLDSVGLTDKNIRGLCQIGENVFAGGANGLYKTTDAGDTWTLTGKSGGTYSLFSIDTTLILGTFAGPFVSRDQGRSWVDSEIAAARLNEVYGITASDGVLFCGCRNGIVGRSADMGKTWRGAPVVGGGEHIHSLFAAGGTLYAGTELMGVYCSIDSGATWHPRWAGLTGTYYSAFIGIGNSVLTGSTDGIQRLKMNDTVWEATDIGLVTTNVYAINVIGKRLFAGAWGGAALLSTDGGIGWKCKNIDNEPIGDQYISAFAASDSVVIAGSWSKGIVRSTDGGRTWQRADTGIAQPLITGLASHGSTLFAGTRRGLYRSFDGAQSWTLLDSQKSASCFTSVGTAMIGGESGGVIVSTDNGNSWVQKEMDYSPSPDVLSITSIDSVLITGTTNGIFVSSDLGSTWESKTNGMKPYPYIVAVAAHNKDLFAATTDEYVYLSTDLGNHWEDITSGLLAGSSRYSFIQTLAVSDSNIFVGVSNGMGMWVRPLSDFNSAIVPSPNVWSSTLSSFPSPLARSTTIRFTTQEYSEVSISIVNLLGTHVAELFSGRLTPGDHSFIWDAGGASPGRYMCVVRSDGHVQQLPILLVR